MPRPSPLFPPVARMLRLAPGARMRSPGQDAWPFGPGAGGDIAQLMSTGLDFSVQDYLAMTRHPALAAASAAAAQSPPLPKALEDRIARFLTMPAATLFASGTEAIRTTFLGLLRPGDDVIVDGGAAPAMFETVLAAQARPHRSPPGSLDGVERRLARLTRQPRLGRLWVAVPAVAPFTSITSDLAELAQLCTAHGAALIADISHDLGAIGQSGGGVMEVQVCLGQVDVVLGSFAKSFGAAGGFAAFRDPDLSARLRPSVALPAARVAAILAAFDLIDSTEGRRRRRCLHGSALRLRNHLMADGLRLLGQPSPLVPLPLPPHSADAMTALLRSAGPVVPLLRAPLVPGNAPRWRILLSSDHGPAEIDDLADLIHDVTRAFDPPRRTRLRSVALPQP